jgi:hypothetical protein
MQQALLCNYGNASNSLLRNSNCYVTMEMTQTRCYATGIVMLLWKCNKLIITQQELLRHHGNAIWCIDNVTKENLICHNSLKNVKNFANLKYFKYCDILGFHSSETGLIRMETSVRITMEAILTIDWCSEATM